VARRSPQTAAKRAREQAKRERRERKEAKKAARNAADSEGTIWQIVKSAAIPSPSGGKSDAAYLVTLVSGSATREVVVEFATRGVQKLGQAAS
jgi:prophage tail gpP-like protein